VIGLATLADLQRTLRRSQQPGADAAVVRDCLRADLLWLPNTANLAQLEDQLRPNGLRQLPVFELGAQPSDKLPSGLPAAGLACSKLCGLASRDGMARALARTLVQT
jgi:hypothetical protein